MALIYRSKISNDFGISAFSTLCSLKLSLTFEKSLLNRVPYVPYVPSCLAYPRAHVPSCLACPRALRAHVPSTTNPLQEEFCCFDGKVKRCKGHTTLTASVYHPLLQKQVVLATMECRCEDSNYVSTFWREFILVFR